LKEIGLRVASPESSGIKNREKVKGFVHVLHSSLVGGEISLRQKAELFRFGRRKDKLWEAHWAVRKVITILGISAKKLSRGLTTKSRNRVDLKRS